MWVWERKLSLNDCTNIISHNYFLKKKSVLLLKKKKAYSIPSVSD